MKLLDRPDISSIRWLSCGKGFEIVAPETFANVTLQQHFQHVKMTSFIRRLNRWGFRQLSRKKYKYQAFRHPQFQRGRKDLCSKIICSAKIAKGMTIHPNSDAGKTQKIMPDLRGRIIPYEQMAELILQGRNAMPDPNTFVNHTNQSNPQLLNLKSNVGALLSQTALSQQFQNSQGNEMLGTELDLRLCELAQNRLLSQGRLIQQNTQFPVSRNIPQNAFSGLTPIQNTLLPVDVLNTYKATSGMQSLLLGMQASPQRQFSAVSAIPQRNVGINEEVPIVSALQNLRDTLLPNSSRLQSPHDPLNVLRNETSFSTRYF